MPDSDVQAVAPPSTPEWSDWAGTDNVVHDFNPNTVGNEDVRKVLGDYKHDLKRSQDWLSRSPSHDEHVGQIDKYWNIWKQGTQDPQNPTPEELETMMDQGVLFANGEESYNQMRKEASEEWRSHNATVVNWPKHIADMESELADHQIGTGKPVVVKGYHGTASGRFDEFDTDRKGVTTGAPSAGEGFFFSGLPDTARSYASYRQGLHIPVKGMAAVDGRIAMEIQDEVLQRFVNTESSPWVSEGEEGEEIVYGRDIETDELNERPLSELRDAVIRKEPWIKDTAHDIMDFHGIDREFDMEPLDPYVHESYVRMRNPFVHDYKGDKYRDTSYMENILEAKKRGYDGVILLNTFDGGPRDHIIVAFEPNQIKASSNRSPTEDNRIDFEKEPERNRTGQGHDTYVTDEIVAWDDARPNLRFASSNVSEAQYSKVRNILNRYNKLKEKNMPDEKKAMTGHEGTSGIQEHSTGEIYPSHVVLVHNNETDEGHMYAQHPEHGEHESKHPYSGFGESFYKAHAAATKDGHEMKNRGKSQKNRRFRTSDGFDFRYRKGMWIGEGMEFDSVAGRPHDGDNFISGQFM
jgi:hypothetical protein